MSKKVEQSKDQQKVKKLSNNELKSQKGAGDSVRGDASCDQDGDGDWDRHDKRLFKRKARDARRSEKIIK